jgi:hypothetical protein
MKAIFYSLTFLYLITSCENTSNREVVINYTVDEEIIESLSTLTLKHLSTTIMVEEIYHDKTEIQRSNRIEKSYLKLKNALDKLMFDYESIENMNSIKIEDRETIELSTQNFSFELIELITREKIHKPTVIVDSLTYNTYFDSIISNYSHESYDTIIIRKIASAYFSVKQKLKNLEGKMSNKKRIQLLLSKNRILKELDVIIYARLLGCNANYSASRMEIITKQVDSLKTKDSITIMLNIAYIMDVTAKEIFVDGITGRGWTNKENFFYRINKNDVDGLIKGRLGILNKAGETKYKDFSTTW